MKYQNHHGSLFQVISPLKFINIVMVKLILMHMFILLDVRRLCKRWGAIDLAPPTIWSVNLFNLVGKGSGHPYYSQIWWKGKVQTGTSVLRVLPPSPQGEHLQHKSPMATPTQRTQLHYAHALPPLLLDIKTGH